MGCENCGADIVSTKRHPVRFCAPCRHERQSIALREHRPPPRKRIGRTKIAKKCPICEEAFFGHTGNRRKIYCSVKCSGIALGQSKKITISREAMIQAINTTDSYIAACEQLGVSPWTFYRRMREEGLKRNKRPYKPRSDGYWDYKTAHNHRRIMERHVGRQLLPREHVHHINGDKKDNDPNKNLIVINGTREHALVHASLQQCAFELYRKGLIGFDRSTLRYFLLSSNLV